MSTVYKSHNAEKPVRVRRRTRIGVVAAAIVAVLAMAGTAFAALTIWGEGTLKAEAAKPAALEIAEPQFTNTLVPGGPAVGVKFKVTNPNDFPVLVNQVVGVDALVSGTCTYTLLAVPGYTVSGVTLNFTAPKQVKVDAGGSAWVTIPNLLKQSPGDTVTCALTAKFKVGALASS